MSQDTLTLLAFGDTGIDLNTVFPTDNPLHCFNLSWSSLFPGCYRVYFDSSDFDAGLELAAKLSKRANGTVHANLVQGATNGISDHYFLNGESCAKTDMSHWLGEGEPYCSLIAGLYQKDYKLVAKALQHKPDVMAYEGLALRIGFDAGQRIAKLLVAEVNEVTEEVMTWAASAYEGNVETLTALVARGGDPNFEFHDQNLFELALWQGKTRCAKQLLAAGADPMRVAERGYYKSLFAALINIKHIEENLKLLKPLGINLETAGPKPYSGLCLTSSPKVQQHLLKLGATWTHRIYSDDPDKALRESVKFDDEACFQQLLADRESLDSKQRAALLQDGIRWQRDWVPKLIDSQFGGDTESMNEAMLTLLQAKKPDVETLRDLLSRGADPNAEYRRYPVLCENSAEIARTLLEFGADPLRPGASGMDYVTWALQLLSRGDEFALQHLSVLEELCGQQRLDDYLVAPPYARYFKKSALEFLVSHRFRFTPEAVKDCAPEFAHLKPDDITYILDQAAPDERLELTARVLSSLFSKRSDKATAKEDFARGVFLMDRIDDPDLILRTWYVEAVGHDRTYQLFTDFVLDLNWQGWSEKQKRDVYITAMWGGSAELAESMLSRGYVPTEPYDSLSHLKENISRFEDMKVKHEGKNIAFSRYLKLLFDRYDLELRS